MDYNPYYDNSYETNKKQSAFLSNGKQILQEQKEQILTHESKKKQDRQTQIEYERKILDQGVVYFQNPGRKEPTREEKHEILKQIDQQSQQNADGGFFAKVFQQRDNKQSIKQAQQQSYADEIQRQIDEKKRKKEEEQKKQKEEDLKYEAMVKRDVELLNERFKKEEEKKQVKFVQPTAPLPLLPTKQKIDQQSKILNEFEDQQISLNLTNNNIVPNYLKDPNIKETDDKYEMELYQQGPYYNPSSQTKRNRQMMMDPNNQQQMMQMSMPQYSQYQPISSGMMERFQREYDEMKTINRLKNAEQEDGLNKLKQELDGYNRVWNEELRRLKADVQVSEEGKQRAFYDLENLKNELRRQEISEQTSLYNMKRNYGMINNQYQQDQKLVSDERYLNSGSRQYGIPSQMDNRISSRMNSFDQRTNFDN